MNLVFTLEHQSGFVMSKKASLSLNRGGFPIFFGGGGVIKVFLFHRNTLYFSCCFFENNEVFRFQQMTSLFSYCFFNYKEVFNRRPYSKQMETYFVNRKLFASMILIKFPNWNTNICPIKDRQAWSLKYSTSDIHKMTNNIW